MGKYEIWANVAKNRLYIKAEGFLTPEENKASADQIIEELNKLKPGFDVIADLAGFKAATQKGTKEWDRIYGSFAVKDIRRAILVVKDEITQMQIVRKGREASYKDEFAASVEEAERMLDNPE